MTSGAQTYSINGKQYTVGRDDYGEGYKYEVLNDYVGCEDDRLKAWLIKGAIGWGETSAWIGPPGSLKSALMADMAVTFAYNRPWHGHKSLNEDGYGVIYFALERADLVKRRIDAQITKLGLDPAKPKANITIISGIIDIVTPEGLAKAIRTVQNIQNYNGELTGIVMFDTHAKLIAAFGGDEDKAKDQGKVFAAIERFKEALGRPHVALVGHTGKDASRGARGSNALYGDVDMLVMIAGGEIKTATVEKANDMPEGELFSFTSLLHEFGKDDDGEPIAINIISDEEVSSQVGTKLEPKLTKNQQTLFGILHDAGRSGLLQEEWNEKAREAGIGVSRKADLVDIRSALKSKGLIRQYGERWSVSHD